MNPPPRLFLLGPLLLHMQQRLYLNKINKARTPREINGKALKLSCNIKNMPVHLAMQIL